MQKYVSCKQNQRFKRFRVIDCIQLNQTQTMSLFYFIDANGLPSFVTVPPLVPMQLAPVPTIFYLPQGVPYIRPQNLPVQQQLKTQETERMPSLPLLQAPAPQSEEMTQTRRHKRTRRRNVEKQLESAKKNSESNIINQVFSFFNTMEKSEHIINRAIKLLGKPESEVEKVRTLFYNIVRFINRKKGRDYVNKEALAKLYTPQIITKRYPVIIERLNEAKVLTVKELCLIFRTTTFYYIKEIAPLAILSSKRISMIAKLEHLKRRRLILQGLYLNAE